MKYKLASNTAAHPMSKDEMMIVRLFLYSLSGVIGACSTIVMVYFKQKSYVVESDPYEIGKGRIEGYIKVGIGE